MIGRVDLNADLGEGMGSDAAMLELVTSANIACGGHAGDEVTMSAVVEAASINEVAVGAHPSFEDRDGFGRRSLALSPEELRDLVHRQIHKLESVAQGSGSTVGYVKLHGALANLAAADAAVASVVVESLCERDDPLAVLAISGTELERVSRAGGLQTYSEVFADRGYSSDGQLVPRGMAGALIDDPHEATDRILGFLETGLMPTVGAGPIELKADSICVHGDNPASVAMAEAIRHAISKEGVQLRSFLEPNGD